MNKPHCCDKCINPVRMCSNVSCECHKHNLSTPLEQSESFRVGDEVQTIHGVKVTILAYDPITHPEAPWQISSHWWCTPDYISSTKDISDKEHLPHCLSKDEYFDGICNCSAISERQRMSGNSQESWEDRFDKEFESPWGDKTALVVKDFFKVELGKVETECQEALKQMNEAWNDSLKVELQRERKESYQKGRDDCWKTFEDRGGYLLGRKEGAKEVIEAAINYSELLDKDMFEQFLKERFLNE